MQIEEASKKVVGFMKMKQRAILEQFAALSKDSTLFHAKPMDYSFCFVPGTRKDRVLLVSHIDTVWRKQTKVDPVLHPKHPDVLVSRCIVNPEDDTAPPYGIGADDRAGVAILWELRKLGHSILLISGEEKGCLGSANLMKNKELATLMQQHQFAIEFDRHGADDLVFYNVGSKKFQAYCEQQAPGYAVAPGTFTDICVLCQTMCGLNISVGYYNEHTTHEYLVIPQWIRTLETAQRWLSAQNIPQFLQPTKKRSKLVEYFL